MNTDDDKRFDEGPSEYTVASLTRHLRSELEPRFGRSEAEWMTRAMWDDLKGYTLTDLATRADSPVSNYMARKMEDVTRRVLGGEPLQYVLGTASFYGMKLEVTPATLIPRPETAELVDMIVDRLGSRSDLRVLDAATGSGCIALALARNLPFASVTAIDISEDALEVARHNAAALRVRGVTFERRDILALASPNAPLFDVIVSNPPYVLDSERPTLDPMVADREPALALFVPDSDPLRFYNALCVYAMDALADGGMIFFEVNPLTAATLADGMKTAGWADVTASADSHGRIRFISAVRPPRS